MLWTTSSVAITPALWRHIEWNMTSHLAEWDVSFGGLRRLIWRNETSHLAEYDVSFGGIWRLIFQPFQNDLSIPALPTSSIRLPLYRKDLSRATTIALCYCTPFVIPLSLLFPLLLTTLLQLRIIQWKRKDYRRYSSYDRCYYNPSTLLQLNRGQVV